MRIQEGKDYCFTQNDPAMKIKMTFILISSVILFVAVSCKDGTGKKDSNLPVADQLTVADGLVPIAKDIITDVIVKPDTLGDPWEVEKVRGFDGTVMFNTLFERIYKGELTVYDCLADETLKPEDIKKIEKDFRSDMSRIAKMQFLEDWYFDPATNGIVKKTKSVSFGYEVIREDGLPSGYIALFRVKI